MEASLDANPSLLREVPSSPNPNDTTDPVLYLGNELDVELWFKGNTEKKQSVLIRTTTPEGVVKSAFMHIDGTVQHIPTFENSDPLVLAKEDARAAAHKGKKVREFKWSPEREKKISGARIARKIILATTALVILFSLITGVLQLRVVLTGSMKPAINPGDLIIAASTKIATPEVDKVVLYGARDLQGKVATVWAHRIISGSVEEGFTIKGDANANADIGTIPVTDIQSVVVATVPHIGRAFNPISLILIFSGLISISLIAQARRRQI
jgi:signal peptidase